MPNWNELGPEPFNPMKAKVEPKETKPAPLTREQAASAIHKMINKGTGAPLKHTLYIPDGYTPWIEVVGDRVTVEMRAKDGGMYSNGRVEMSGSDFAALPSNIFSSIVQGNSIKYDIPEAVYATSTDMEAYWDSVAEWVDAQAAGMPTATD